MASLTFLGPQRLQPTIAQVLSELSIDGPVAAITAGWQEREAELEELSEHLGRSVTNLLLHQRGEAIFADDTKLAEAYRERQDRLIRLQKIYRLRLGHVLGAARELMAAIGEDWLFGVERASAIKSVRRLDRHHLARLGEVHADYEARIAPLARDSVRRHRDEIAELLADCEALMIAGGHVAVLINRLRLLGVLELWGDKPIVAWSAGAMVLAGRIVLFHDSPPWGAGDAEVLESGLGLAPEILPLPHARQRLRLSDPQRVSLLARRFAPARAITLDPGARLTRPNGKSRRWQAHGDTFRLTPKGKVVAAELR